MTTATVQDTVTSTGSRDESTLAGAALRAMAANPGLRAAFLRSSALRDLFSVPAGRYVVAHDRDGLRDRLALLSAKGYRTGVEYVGEEVTDPAEVEAIVQEYLALIAEAAPGTAEPVQLGFDLSNVGSLISPDLARENTSRILRAAQAKNITVVISMERSGFVDDILKVFHELAPEHPNVGLTLQAHLHRTPEDLDAVAGHGRKVRLVKGVYRESPHVALPRGAELNERYADLAARLLDRGVPLACGTHDAATLSLLDERGLIGRLAEIEMLHGVQPALLRACRTRGVPCRVATVYGENWWLHFLHRLAEHPPNVLTALADMADPGRVRFGEEY
ncbi:proline dehydrogenase family protein [Microbispora bryophytorum]|uniref:proline dehydrogenase family protein n=1 Tax=Microbispora bryophytorum TaxID=1460882 RepID=UPI0033CEC615